MKIAIVGQRWNPSHPTIFRGGSEKTESEHIRLLSEGGDEIHFITNEDSSPRPPPITQHYVGLSKHALKGRLPGTRSPRIKATLEKIAPEIAIIHDDGNPSLCEHLASIQFPSVIFIHSAPAGGMSVFAYIESLWLCVQKGHTTVCMSEQSRRDWQDYVRYCKKTLLKRGRIPEKDIDEGTFFTEVMHPAVLWEQPKVVPSQGGFLSVGRLERWKKHNVALAAHPEVKVYTVPPWEGSDESVQYLKELTEKFGATRVNAEGLPHSELMRVIASADALLVLNQESFGLTAFEANSMGVPVILMSSKSHSVEEICAPSKGLESLRIVKSPQELKELLEVFERLPIERKQEISQKSWETYNRENVLSQFSGLIERSLARFKQVSQKPPLENDDEDVFSFFAGN